MVFSWGQCVVWVHSVMWVRGAGEDVGGVVWAGDVNVAWRRMEVDDVCIWIWGGVKWLYGWYVEGRRGVNQEGGGKE